MWNLDTSARQPGDDKSDWHAWLVDRAEKRHMLLQFASNGLDQAGADALVDKIIAGLNLPTDQLGDYAAITWHDGAFCSLGCHDAETAPQHPAETAARIEGRE